MGKIKLTKDQWQKLDWTKSNAELGRLHGVSRVRVAQVRKMLGRKIPAAINQRKIRLARLGALIEANRQLFDGYAPATRIMRELNVAKGDYGLFLQLCREKSMPLGRVGSVFPKMNFKLPNTDLDRIWGLRRGRAAMYRMTHRLGKSSWDLRTRSKIQNDQARALTEAVENELRKKHAA